MKHFNVPKTVFILFLSLVMLTSSACQSHGGYGGIPWNYGEDARQAAQQPPNTLAGAFKNRSGSAELTTAQGSAPRIQQAGFTLSAPGSNAYSAMQEPAAPPSVKVGLLLPLSGEHAALGQAMLQSAQIALFDVGFNQFELMPRDTAGTSDGAREAAREVIRDGAQMILGPVFSHSVSAVRSIAGRSNVNVIAFSTDWTKAGSNTFIMGFLPFDQIERIIDFATQQGYQRIGVIAPRTAYGNAVVNAYTTIAALSGLQTPEMLRFSPQTGNLAPDIRDFTNYDQRQARKEQMKMQSASMQLAASGQEEFPYDAVLMAVGGEQALSVGNLLSHYELPPGKVKRLGTGLLDDPGLANEAGLDRTWFAAPSPRLRQAFEGRFRNIYGYAPPRLSTLAYDATALAAVLARRGLENMGQPAFDRRSIMNPNGFAGIDGIFRFNPNGTAERGLAILEFRRGNIRIVDDAPNTFQQSSAN